MEPLRIETARLTIVPFTEQMAESVCRNSLDRDNREFLPDEVFETPADALDTIRFLRGCYDGEGPRSTRCCYATVPRSAMSRRCPSGTGPGRSATTSALRSPERDMPPKRSGHFCP